MIKLKIEDLLVLPQNIKVRWNGRNKLHYVAKGYTYTKHNEEFEVNVLDLNPTSKTIVKAYCQYCKEQKEHAFSFIISRFDKFCCKNCTTKKYKETCLERFGVDNPAKSENTKEQIEKTNLEKYGVKNVFQADETKEKIKEKNIQNHGVEWFVQSDDFKNKSEKTNINKYGVKNVYQRKENREKAIQSMINKYGVDNPMKVPEIASKSIRRARESMYKNGTAPSSAQQRYLHEILGGELNFPVDRCWLDIAFPAEKIYVEYDGGGHDLIVKIGVLSKEEFIKKEIKRDKYLNSLGWKMIRIINNKDKKIEDSTIKKLIFEAKNYLLNNKHSWVKIDMDNMIFICYEYNKKI